MPAMATDDADLPDELVLLRATLRGFVDEHLVPLERLGGRPDEPTVAALREQAKALGLFLPEVPEEMGGPGLSMLGRTVFWEEIGRSPAMPARDGGVFGPVVGPVLLHRLDPAQRERYLFPVLRGERLPCFALTEPDAGSDPAAIRLRAVRDGAHYVVSGTKRFITDADRADFAQLVCVTDPARGARGGISLLLVDLDSPGVRIAARYETMMGDRPCELALDEVRVPAANLVGAEGDGLRLAQDWITEGRILRHGARSCGVAERCLELAARQVTHRVTFGAPLADRQAAQLMLADTYAELQAARGLVRRAARALDAGRDARLDSWVAKTVATEMGFRAADRCLQLHGGLGLTRDLPIERMWREQRSFMITEGAAEVMRVAIARRVIETYGGGSVAWRD